MSQDRFRRLARRTPQKRLVALAAGASLSALVPQARATDYTWATGDFPGSAVPTPPGTLLATDTLGIVAGGTKRFVGGAFTNLGHVRWFDDNLQGGNSAGVSNAGLWEAMSDTTSLSFNFGGQPTFANTATFRKNGGTGSTTIGSWLWVNNGGTIDAQTGFIDFDGSSAQFNDGSSFIGAGAVRVRSSAGFSGNFKADNLQWTGGTFTGSAAVLAGGVQTAGRATWSGGDFQGSWTLGAATTLTVVDGAAKRQVGGSIVNNGNVVWNSTAAFQGGNSGVFTNSGLYEATASHAVTYNFGGQNTFANRASGTVRATNGATLTFGGVALVNDGGALNAAAGASIAYTGNSNRFDDGTRFTGAGTQVISGNSRFVGTFHADGPLTIAGATQTGGDGSPGSKAILAGALSWSTGDLQGSWEIGSGSTLTAVDDAGSKRQVGGSIVNNGNVVWNSTAAFQGGNSGVFTNSGLYEATASHAVTYNFGGQNTFANQASGTVRATNGATLTFGGVALASDGGRFEATDGSSIVYAGGSARFNDGTEFVGAGSQRITDSARFVGGVTGNGHVILTGGTFTGGDGSDGSEGRLLGGYAWSGGDLQGSWRIASGATLTALDSGSKRQVGGSVVNDGTLRWGSSDAFQGGNSGVFTNNGFVDIQTDADVTHNFGGQNAFVNAGRLVKSGGSGETSLAGVALANPGLIDVQTGTVRLPGNFTNGGTLMGSGTFATNLLTNSGHVAPGESPGTLGIAGNFAQSALGTFDVELSTLGATDLLDISGTAALDGTLALRCYALCSFAVGDEIVILDSVGDLGGSFASVTMSGFETGAFDVVYDTVGDRVLLSVTQTVTAAVPEPSTWALWLGGAGLLAFARRRRMS